MDDIQYITTEQAIEIHSKTVDLSGGGTKGIIDQGQLESVLQHIQNDTYYPDFEDKLTHLFFALSKFHCFQDGNKRISVVLCTHMLLINGYLHCSERFLREMENITYYVAQDAIDKDFLKEIIEAVINDEMDNEELKLRVIEAMRSVDHENLN